MRRDPATATAHGVALAVVLVAAGLLVGYPLVRLAVTVWVETGGEPLTALEGPGVGTAVRNSVLLAVTVSGVAVPLGAGLALALRRRDVPGRGLWSFGVVLPLLVPDFVLGYSWVQAYGRAGFTESLLGLGWGGLAGPVGVATVLVVNAVPVTFLVTAVGLATRAEPGLARAARASGADATTVLRTVTLPLLRPVLAAAALLVFVLTLGAFAIPLVLGRSAGFATATTRIYADLARSGDPASFVEAVALALVLVVVAASVVLPADALLGPRLRVRRQAVADLRLPDAPHGGWGAGVAVAVGGYLLVTLVLPLVALLAAALTRAVGLPPSPSNWTLAHLAAVLDERTLAALGRSLLLSSVAATVLVVLGGAVAVLERGRSGRWFSALVTLTLALPGSTLAVALMIAYGRWLTGSLLLIAMAYVAKLWTFAHRPLSGALDRLPTQELHAARVSGAGPWTAVRTVALRPLAPALAAGWLLCFLTAMHEITMSSLLYGPGDETLAVVVLNAQELGQVGPTAALSVLLTLLVALPAASWLALRRRFAHAW